MLECTGKHMEKRMINGHNRQMYLTSLPPEGEIRQADAGLSLKNMATISFTSIDNSLPRSALHPLAKYAQYLLHPV